MNLSKKDLINPVTDAKYIGEPRIMASAFATLSSIGVKSSFKAHLP